VSVGIALYYYNQENGIVGTQNKMGFFFGICFYLSALSIKSIILFEDMKIQYYREMQHGYYSMHAWFTSKIIYNIFMSSLLHSLIIDMSTYWFVGLQLNRFGTFWFTITLVSISADIVCIIIGIIVGRIATSKIMILTLGVLIYIPFFLFNVSTSGLLQNPRSIPGWLKFLSYFAHFKIAYELLLINEFSGRSIKIDPKGVPAFTVEGEWWLAELDIFPNRFQFDVIALIMFIVIYFYTARFLFLKCLRVTKG